MSSGLLSQIAGAQRGCMLVGLGKSSYQLAKVLVAHGIKPLCIERKSKQQFLIDQSWEKRCQELLDLGVLLYFGIDGEAVVTVADKIEVAALSPGVSLEGAICGALRRRGVRLVSQLELAVELWPGQVLLVTGANGKSSTAALICHFLESSGRSALRVSNAQEPFVQALSEYIVDAAEPGKAILVVEASGFELEASSVLQPDLAIYLNLSDRDLERFGSDSRVFMAEKQAFMRQSGGQFAIINRDDPWGKQLLAGSPGTVCSFGTSTGSAQESWAVDIVYQPQAGLDRLVLRRADQLFDLKVPDSLIGLHNRYNLAAAVLAACCLGIAAEDLAALCSSIKPLPDRLEILGEFDGVLWINDAKSTSAMASWAAVRAVMDKFSPSNLTLLLGGQARACSWQPFLHFLAKRAGGLLHEVVCFGQDAPLLADHCRANGVPHRSFKELGTALAAVRVKAVAGGVVLFSPGCASFDQFSGYDQRADFLKNFLRSKGAQ